MVSVCIASYNGEKYIVRQIQSILDQLGPDDEIVVSDDSSSDRTEYVVRAMNDNRIRFVHHEPSGITANFENAVRNAKGDYIFFADQDDEWLPGKIDRVLRAFEDSECLVVQHDAVVVDEHGDMLFPSFSARRGIRKGVFLNLVKTCYIGCCMAFRRELLVHALPFRGNRYGNLHDEWIGFVAELHGGVCYIPDILIKYIRHEGTASQMTPGPFWRQVVKRLVIVHNLVAYKLSRILLCRG